MQFDLEVKAGDLSPAVLIEVLDENGDAVSLSGVTAVNFTLRREGAADDAFTKTATNPTASTLKYQWTGTDTALPAGMYLGQFEVTAGGLNQSYPATPLKIVITGDLTEETELDFPWCSMEEARSISRSPLITEDSLSMAHTSVEIIVGRFAEELTGLENPVAARDYRILKRMVALMSRWLLAHPDYFEQMEMKKYSTGITRGSSVDFAADAQLCPPHVKRLAAMLSWMGSRSRDLSEEYGAGPALGYDMLWNDNHTWKDESWRV